MNESVLQKVSGAIISCFIASQYLESLKDTSIFKHSLKNKINKCLSELEEIESNYFDKLDLLDEKTTHQITSNSIEFIEWLLNDFNYHDVQKIKELCFAYSIDSKRVNGITRAILKDYEKNNKR